MLAHFPLGPPSYRIPRGFQPQQLRQKSRTTSLNACSKERSRAQTHQMVGRILAGGEVYLKLLNSKGINSVAATHRNVSYSIWCNFLVRLNSRKIQTRPLK